MALISGKCNWAKVYNPDRTYAKEVTGGVWSVDLLVDSSNESVLKKEGLDHLIQTKPDGTRYIKFKRNEFSKEGKANKPPNVVDSQKVPMKMEIGNGSTVNISFTTYTGYKSKQYATLQTIQVVSLIPYKRKTNDKDPLWNLEKVDGGFTQTGNDDDLPFEAASGDV